MNDREDKIVSDAVAESPDTNTRRALWILGAIALLGLLVAFVALYVAFHEQQQKVEAGEDLATQVNAACGNTKVQTNNIEDICEQAKVVKGEAGPQGVQGVQGIQGFQGLQGLQGPQGEQGPRGETGPKGPRGFPGSNGQNGSTGIQGEVGPTGPAGPQGEIGPSGSPGPQGPTGERGPAGYPDSFTYTTQNGLGQETTYVCTDPDGDHSYTCEEKENP